MKRETYRHPKTYDLSARLKCSRPEAIGFLTLLWDWATETALAGNVGRWANGAIARACDWTGCPDLFVNSLVGAGWLDEDPDHRLVIHDWGQHCENWVRAKAQKLGVSLLGCQKPPSQEPDLRDDLKNDLRDDLKSGSFPRDLTEPNRTKEREPETDSRLPASKKPNPTIPPELLTLVDAWNRLSDGIAPRVTKPDSKSILAGWAKVQREPELKPVFANVAGLIQAIEASEFLHGKSWFQFSWLFAKDKDRVTWNAIKVIERRYGGQQAGAANPTRPRVPSLAEMKFNAVGGYVGGAS